MILKALEQPGGAAHTAGDHANKLNTPHIPAQKPAKQALWFTIYYPSVHMWWHHWHFWKTHQLILIRETG